LLPQATNYSGTLEQITQARAALVLLAASLAVAAWACALKPTTPHRCRDAEQNEE
jgi:hypothetical protein